MGLGIDHLVDGGIDLIAAQAFCAEVGTGLGKRGIAAVDRLRQMGMMHLGTVFPDGSEDRGHKGARTDPREIAQPGRRRHLLRRQAVIDDGLQRHEKEGHGNALDERWHQDDLKGRLHGEVRTHPADQAVKQEGDARKQARVDQPDLAANQRRERERKDTHRCERQPGPGRGVAHPLLQPQRQQDEIAEEQTI